MKLKDLLESNQEVDFNKVRNRLRFHFGHILFEKRVNGFKVTVEARQGKPEEFKEALEKALKEADVVPSNVTIIDQNRATVKF